MDSKQQEEVGIDYGIKDMFEEDIYNFINLPNDTFSKWTKLQILSKQTKSLKKTVKQGVKEALQKRS
eukprot:UN17053